MSKKYLLTPAGLKKMNLELKDLVTKKRPEVIERIREAAAHGDLSENADYAQAREEQSFIEGRIQEIEDMIKTIRLYHKTNSTESNIMIKLMMVMCMDIALKWVLGSKESPVDFLEAGEKK